MTATTRQMLLDLAAEVFRPCDTDSDEVFVLADTATGEISLAQPGCMILEGRLAELGAEIRRRWGFVGRDDPRAQAQTAVAEFGALLARYEQAAPVETGS